MSELKIASRYAKALVDLSVEQNNIDVILGNMKDFIDVMRKNYQIVTILKSPVINGDHKMHVLNRLFAKSFHKNTMAFFQIIIRKNRAYYLPLIAKVFTEQYNTLNNIMQATVKTAQPVDQNIIVEIKKLIATYSGKNVELHTIVDPRLIGGLVIQMEDRLFDGSISGKLNKLKHELNNTYISK